MSLVGAALMFAAQGKPRAVAVDDFPLRAAEPRVAAALPDLPEAVTVEAVLIDESPVESAGVGQVPAFRCRCGRT